MKSKDVNITVTKSDVYYRVRRHSSYLGSKDLYGGNVTDHDRIYAAKDDEVMLAQLWDKTFPMLVSLMQRYMYRNHVDYTEDGADLKLTMPMSFNDVECKPLLEDECTAYLCISILIQWLDIANAPEDAKVLQEELKAHALAIKDILARREMPLREEPCESGCKCEGAEITIETA